MRVVFFIVLIIVIAMTAVYIGVAREFYRHPRSEQILNISPFLGLNSTPRSEVRDRAIQKFLDEYKFDRNFIDCSDNIKELSQCLIFVNMLQYGGADGIAWNVQLSADSEIFKKIYYYYPEIDTRRPPLGADLNVVASQVVNEEPSRFRFFLKRVGLGS